MTPTSIVIDDDHALFLHGLRRLFDDWPEFCIVGEAASGAETIELAWRLAFDILLLDFQLGDMTGLDVLRRIGPGKRFQTILLVADIQRKDEVNAMMLGASGIVRKFA